MIIYNYIGVGMLALAALIAGLFAAMLCKFDWFLSYGKPVCFAAIGVFMIVLDLWYRMTRGEGSLLHPRRGGQFFFIPVWIIGGVWIMASFCEGFGTKPDVSARQSYPSAQPSLSQPSSYPAASPSPQSLKLGMISGVGPHRIASINGQPFALGETHKLSIGLATRMVQCAEIRDQSVIIKLSGDSHPHELKIGEPLPLNRQ
jgi:hypothetical protein